jgi:hypothetical protein
MNQSIIHPPALFTLSEMIWGKTISPSSQMTLNIHVSSDVEAEAEVLAFWWKQKRKHLKICSFRFRSVSKLVYKFW